MSMAVERLTAEINVDPSRAISALNAFSAELDRVTKDRRAKVKVQTDSASTKRAEDEINKIARDRTAKIKVESDTGTLKDTARAFDEVSASAGGAGDSVGTFITNIDNGHRGLGMFGLALKGLLVADVVGAALVGAAGGVQALGGAATGAVAGLAGLSGVLGALPVGLGAVTAALGSTMLGFSGVTQGVKAMSAVTGQGAAATKNMMGATRGLADATKSLSRAQKDLADAQDKLAKARAQAAADIAEAKKEAAKDLAEAQKAEARARKNEQEALQDATANLADIRKQAAENLKDARKAQVDQAKANAQELVDASWGVEVALHNEERAIHDLERAQKNLEEAQNSVNGSTTTMSKQTDAFTGKIFEVASVMGDATDAAKDQADAQWAVKEAEMAVAQSKRDSEAAEKRLTTARTESGKKSTLVADTQKYNARSIADAEERLAEVKEDIADRENYVTGVRAKNAERIAEVTKRSADNIVAAQERVANAQETVKRRIEDLAAAHTRMKDVQTGGTAATNAYAKAMDNLSPAGQRFVKFINDEMMPAIKRLRFAAQEGLLPGVQKGLTSLLSVWPDLVGWAGKFAKSTGDAFAGFMDHLTSKDNWAKAMQSVQAYYDVWAGSTDANGKRLKGLSDALIPINDILIGIVNAAAPMTKLLTDDLVRGLDSIAAKVNSDTGFAKLTGFFNEAYRWGGLFMDVLRPLGGVIGDVVVAAKPLAEWMLKSMADYFEDLHVKTQKFSKDGTLTKWFTDQQPLIKDVTGLVLDLFGVFNMKEMRGKDSPLARFVSTLRKDAVPALESLMRTLAEKDVGTTFGKIVTGFIRLFDVLASSHVLEGFAWAFDKVTGALMTMSEKTGGKSDAVFGWLITGLVGFGLLNKALGKVSGSLTGLKSVAKGAGKAMQFVTGGGKASSAAGSVVTPAGGGMKGGKATNPGMMAGGKGAKAGKAGKAAKMPKAGKAVGGLTKSLGKLGKFAMLLFNPWALVIGLIIGGLVLLYKKSETFRKVVDAAWAGIKKAGKAVVDWWTGSAWPAIKTFFSNIGGGMVAAKDKIAGAWDSIKSKVSSVKDWIVNTAWPALKKTFYTLSGFIPVVAIYRNWDKITDKFKAVWEWIKGGFKKSWAGIKLILTDPIGSAKTAITKLLNASGLRKPLARVWTWVRNTFKKWWKGTKAIFTDPVDSAKIVITRLLSATGLRKPLTRVWMWVRDTFKKWWRGTKKIFTDPVDSAKTAITKLLSATGLRKPVLAVWTWVRDKFRKSWNGIKKIFTDPISTARDTIKRILGKTGLQNTFRGARDAIGKVWAGIKDKIKNPLKSVMTFIDKKFISKVKGLLHKVNLGSLSKKIPYLTPGGKGYADGGKVAVPRRAAGGVIPGPYRGPKADNVLGVSDSGMPVARVNPREYITNVKSTARMEKRHPGALDYINRHGELPGFAIGGKTAGLDSKFLNALSKFNAAAGGRYSVYSGFRSNAEQKVLYDRYLAGKGNVAAPPGKSRHNSGFAADLAPSNAGNVHAALAAKFGLGFPVKSPQWEPWHIELNGNRSGGGGGGGFFTGLLRKIIDKGAGPLKNILNTYAKGKGLFPKMAIGLMNQTVGGFSKLIQGSGKQIEESTGDGTAGTGNYKGGNVEKYRPTVLKALSIMGLSSKYANSTLRRMNQESSGNPGIVNMWDSNWKAGHPSVGLMQVIRGTYAAYKNPLYDKGPYKYGVSINPLANILASMKYATRTYGNLFNAYDRKGGYGDGGLVGRQFGGSVTAGNPVVVGEKRPEVFIPNRSGRIVPSTDSFGRGGGVTKADMEQIANRLVEAAKPNVNQHNVFGERVDTKRLARDIAWSLR